MTRKDDTPPPADAWDLLKGFLSPERQKKMETAAASRTHWIQLVLQDVHDPHNIAACMRSAEALGINNIHVISRNKTRISSVAKGVEHWLDVTFHETIPACAKFLKAQGLLLAAAYPKQASIPVSELPITRPIAIIFGNEHEGLSSLWDEHLDIHFHIPMFGFVESLNISVSAAISMYQLAQACRQNAPDQFHLSSLARENLLSTWICRQFRSWKPMLERIREGGACRSENES